ncbi:MAG TPA: flagellar basal-body rod protein FlgF [Pedomonas sp.]|nr:flagellar basal-body rod protein FlgF [Pedomonas sp.]
MDTMNYVAVSHQMALQRQMAVISNNVANMNTPAYKREQALFEATLSTMPSAPVHSARPVSFVLDQGMTRDLTQGQFISTDDPLHVALLNDGYFTVTTPEGERAYTRNGQFRLDGEGFLVTEAGARVLDDAGQPIQFAPEEAHINIADDGTISSNLGPRGRLGITGFENEFALTKIGDTLLTGEGGEMLPADQVRVKAGMFEGSNVKPVVEMTNMIEVLRSYQSTTRLLERYNDVRQQGIERLARVQ